MVLAVGPAQATPGVLDSSFGLSGTVTTTIGYDAIARALTLQPDGKIVVAGVNYEGSNSRVALARYAADGTLDPGFGSGGITTTEIGQQAEAYAVALQPNGKIIVAGPSSLGGTSPFRFTLARYDPDGALDPTFGSGGIVTTLIGSESIAYALALQPDGKLVVSGRSYDASRLRFALARYNVDGTLDSSFGSGGIVTAAASYWDQAYAIALQPDAKILAAGSSIAANESRFALARFGSDGTLDTGFGSGGFVTTAIQSADAAAGVAVQPDGKIVLAGQSSNGSQIRFALTRYNLDGTLDPGFGSGGIVMTAIGSGAFAYGLALQPDGKIVAGGAGTDAQVQFAVARYSIDGTLDPGFGDGGITTTAIGSRDEINGVSLQPDGKIVAAGMTFDGSVSRFALARYMGSTLTVARAGSGFGRVTSTPVGIDCGTTCSAPFAALPVTLTPTAAHGSSFAGWSGDCSGTGACTVQLGGDRNVTATFESDKTVTVTMKGSGSGTVRSIPAGIDCGPTCEHAFTHGTTITLTASAIPGSRFAGWEGECTGTGSCTFLLTSNSTLAADFEPLCRVPKLKGKTLVHARKALRRAHCALGKVRRVYSARVKRGRVIAQKPKPGRVLQRGAKVNVTLSKGKKR